MLKSLFFCSLTLLLLACESGPETPLLTQFELPQEVLRTQVGEVKRGQGLFQALKNVSITDATLSLGLINALRDEVEFSKLKVGDRLEATFNQDQKLVAFAFSQNPAEKHVVQLNKATGAWDYSFIEEPTYWQTRIIEGELKANSTLQEDLVAQGLPRSVVAEVVSVLLCKVNFRAHARMGDKYKILLNERVYNDSAIETEVLYTSYEGKIAGLSQAYYYKDDEKGSTYTAHYTEDGQALIRSGLRYPLARLHIRSGYGFRRHPVTGRRAMHRGVDFRGRVGTPVHAVAHGIVVESTYNKYAGNKVAIKHADGSTSFYLHLHNRKVKKGSRVKAHQIIGTVGATGRVTGPHLHFGFKKPNGTWMNPMMKRMIATPKLKGDRFEKLQEQIARTKGLLQDLELSQVARYLVAEIPNRVELDQNNWEKEFFGDILKLQQEAFADINRLDRKISGASSI